MPAAKIAPVTFSSAVSTLATQGFDVAPATAAAAPAVRVSKYNCAAELAPAPDATTLILVRPGCLLAGHITRLVDRGYQKFLSTPALELPATAPRLTALHNFEQELERVLGADVLYNQSLGTTSDLYQYDRLTGRN
jgi:hypothetical protein